MESILLAFGGYNEALYSLKKATTSQSRFLFLRRFHHAVGSPGR